MENDSPQREGSWRPGSGAALGRQGLIDGELPTRGRPAHVGHRQGNGRAAGRAEWPRGRRDRAVRLPGRQPGGPPWPTTSAPGLRPAWRAPRGTGPEIAALIVREKRRQPGKASTRSAPQTELYEAAAGPRGPPRRCALPQPGQDEPHSAAAVGWSRNPAVELSVVLAPRGGARLSSQHRGLKPARRPRQRAMISPSCRGSQAPRGVCSTAGRQTTGQALGPTRP